MAELREHAPTSSPTDARHSVETFLIAGVLRAVERSMGYRDPARWTKPVVIRWRTAWTLDPHPENSERHRSRLLAAQRLAEAGAATVTYDKPPYEDRPRTIRCTAAQCATLESLARANGITPLRDALATVRSAWQSIRQTPVRSIPVWWLEYETRITESLDNPAPSGIGITADRLVNEWPQWLDSLKAARGIAGGATGYERVVSERLLGHSKRLASVRRMVAAQLQAADPRWAESVNVLPASVVLAEYGVRRVAPTVDVAGPIYILADGSQLDVSRIEGLARLPGQWACAIAEAARAARIRTVTTVENETTAWGYVEECGGPEGLAKRRELVIYTSGFAATIGAETVANLKRALPDADFRHWGDADGPGMQVWLDLSRRSGTPLQWWRTTAAWVEKALSRSSGAPIMANERRVLEQLVQDLRGNPACDPGGHALACAEALLRVGLKIEQESFEPSLDTTLGSDVSAYSAETALASV